MTNFFILDETFTNGLNSNVIDLISLTSILCGILVIVSKNPIVSVLFLIGLFLNIAGYLMMLGMNFIGLSYLLVYVGAVSILFLFILMLINVRISELTSDSSNSIPLAVLIGIFLYNTLYKLLPSNFTLPKIFYLQSKFNGTRTAMEEMEAGVQGDYMYYLTGFTSDGSSLSNYDVSYVTSQMWDGALSESSHITSIGNVIYTAYPLWLILTSLILLLAMVGAIVITIKK